VKEWRTSGNERFAKLLSFFCGRERGRRWVVETFHQKRSFLQNPDRSCPFFPKKKKRGGMRWLCPKEGEEEGSEGEENLRQEKEEGGGGR